MPKKHYDWELGQPPPEIELHSLTKHKVYEQYLKHYIRVLNGNPLIPECRLSVIDAFAGGGEYLHSETKESYKGSPCRFLEAVTDGEELVNKYREEQNTKTKLKIKSDFYFIEKKKSNLDYLKWYLSEQGYTDRFDKDIHLIKGEFSPVLPEVISKLQDKGKRHGCLFVLDQYGYKDVPFSDIRLIFKELPKAEVILTFATDSLINYMSDTKSFKNTLEKIDLNLNIDELLENKKDTREWRTLAQHSLHEKIFRQSSANHYTPFFITSKKSGRSFWLIHLSNHPKARDVMMELHWSLKNHFSHNGGPGLNMMQGYDPSKDEDQIDIFARSEFTFDSFAEDLTAEALLQQIPEAIYTNIEGIRYGDFYRIHANNMPATDAQLKKAMALLNSIKELKIVTPVGGTRRAYNTIKDDDIIRFPSQRIFLFNNKGLLDLKKKDNKK